MRNVVAGAIFAGAFIVATACGISAVGSLDATGGVDASGVGDAIGSDGNPNATDGGDGTSDGGNGGDANPTNDSGGPAGRVPGALALYTFDDGTGKKVSDVSGVAPALDLTIQVNDDTRWTDGGLAVDGTSLLFSQAATKIITAAKSTNEVTVEVWIKPSTKTNGTIQRITGISVDVPDPVVTISAQDDSYLFRVRTSGQANDGENDVFTDGGVTLGLQHVVMTRSADGKQRGYVDGKLAVEHATIGDLSTWSNLAISVANEHTAGRPWLGELRLVAYYGRALSAAEVQQNFTSGP